MLRPRNPWRWWLAGIGVLSLALALGTTFPLRGWLYDLFLPARYFRHAAIFRGYFIFVTTVLAAEACRDCEIWLSWRRRRGTSSGAGHPPRSGVITRGRTSLRVTAIAVAAIAVAAYVALRMVVIEPHEDRFLADLHVGLVWGGIVWLAFQATRTKANRGFSLPTAVLFLGTGPHSVLSTDTGTVCDVSSKLWKAVSTVRCRDIVLPDLNRYLPDELSGFSENKNLLVKRNSLYGYQPLNNDFHVHWTADSRLAVTATSVHRCWYAPFKSVIQVSPCAANFEAYRQRVHQTATLPVVIHQPIDLVFPFSHLACDAAVEQIKQLPAGRQIDVELERYTPDMLAFRCTVPEAGYVLVTDRGLKAGRLQSTAHRRQFCPRVHLSHTARVRREPSAVRVSTLWLSVFDGLKLDCFGCVLIVPSLSRPDYRVYSLQASTMTVALKYPRTLWCAFQSTTMGIDSRSLTENPCGRCTNGNPDHGPYWSTTALPMPLFARSTVVCHPTRRSPAASAECRASAGDRSGIDLRVQSLSVSSSFGHGRRWRTRAPTFLIFGTNLDGIVKKRLFSPPVTEIPKVPRFESVINCFACFIVSSMGRRVNVGNFSIIPGDFLGANCCAVELWNHFAGQCSSSLADRCGRSPAWSAALRTLEDELRIPRHARSSAISVYGDEVGTPTLARTSIAIALTTLAMAVVIGVRLFTNLAIPGWATTAFGLLLVLQINALFLSTVFALLILQSRNAANFMPLRDYQYYIAGLTRISSSGGADVQCGFVAETRLGEEICRLS